MRRPLDSSRPARFRSGSGRLLAAGALALGALAAASAVSTAPPAAPPPPAAVARGEGVPEPLAALGIPVSAGAAPGYVPDRTCATCHAAIARSYAEVGMARSFFRPSPERLVEDFSAPPFEHAPSRQRFQIVRQGGELTFRRWTLDAGGRAGPPLEQKIDWILGSGHHARSYLYRTPDGALFQLPLEWYGQERRWGMAPGYDRPDHDGVLRRVRRECLFCHDAYPETPAGGDGAEAPHHFPAELPEGTGCQRCHGPGAEHVRRAMGGIDVREGIRAAIVNPAKLAPTLRDDVCDQCHLQPIVALAGTRRLGRGDYSYRPGQALPEYQVLVDAQEEGGAEADRFEIDHQSYRMRKSRCFTAAPSEAARLSCLSCHDPHRRVGEGERAEHYRAACQSCHPGRACARPRSEDEAALPADRGDCVSCHMPKRRPRDVVHVVMTDHLIRRRPGGAELTAPLTETEPVLTGVRVFEPSRRPSAWEAEVYRALPVARAGTSDEALAHLEKLLAAAAAAQGGGRVPEATLRPLRLELAAGYLRRRQYARAEELLLAASREEPPSARTLEWLGLARDGLGKAALAEESLRAALALPGVERAEVSARLAQILARAGRHREAVDLLLEAVALRPNLAAAWLQLGASQTALGESGAARRSLERALRLDPRLEGAGRTLRQLGEPPT